MMANFYCLASHPVPSISCCTCPRDTNVSWSTEKSSQARSQRNRLEVANNWMSHLKGYCTETLVDSYIKDNPKKAKELIANHHPKLFSAVKPTTTTSPAKKRKPPTSCGKCKACLREDCQSETKRAGAQPN